MNKSIAATILMVLISTITVAQNDSALVNRIDQYLIASEQNGYSGSILIAKGDEILLTKGYGWADRKKKILNHPTTVFNIGSVTKQFTATAIVKLMEDGKLNVNDKIVKYFPDAPEDKSYITIHQLLTHTSGISPRTGGFRYDEATKAKFLNEFFKSKLIHEPGTKHRYANANYIVLAAIIEDVSQQDYETYLRENLWNQAGLKHTSYKYNNSQKENIAQGYEFQMKTGKWEDWGTTKDHLPNSSNHWYSIGKGDIQSNVIDLYKWHIALGENKVISSDSKKLLETAFVKENEEGVSHYGYGWAILQSPNGNKFVTHNGSNGIYFADFIRNVDNGTVIIVLSNVNLNLQIGNVGWEIARMNLDSNYIPKVIPKNNYELVFRFMESNSVKEANLLVHYIQDETGIPFKDKTVLNRIGYTLVSEKLDLNWGIALLKLNTSIFPKDGNLWDTIGEAYFILGDKKNAIASFENALSLAPKENCHWCKNSTEKLNKMTDE
jgi:CubicO group peptidase (beta-lactamase class C family)